MEEFNNNEQTSNNSNQDPNNSYQDSNNNLNNQNNSYLNQNSSYPNQNNNIQNPNNSYPNQNNSYQNPYNNYSNPYGSGPNPNNNNTNYYGNSQEQYNNNSNQYNSNNQYNQNQYNQNQYNKVPEYSFWAEQMPNNNNAYYNQGANAGQYGNNTANSNNRNVKKTTKKKHEHKVLKGITKALCFGIIAGISFIGFQKIYGIISPKDSTANILSAISNQAGEKYEVGYTESGTVKVKDKSAITEVTDATIPSIVQINCKATQTASDWFGQQYNQEVEGSGSGIIVSKTEKELLIATNNHVVEGATEITVTFKDGTKAKAEIKGTDTTADLAVIAVDISTIKEKTLNAISVAKLGNSDNVKVGEIAIAIGNALGYGQSVTVGYISAKDREVDIAEGNTSKKMTLLQTDAAINPGNSGGALLNSEGEVIGINTVKYASEEVEGMGYAIPISKATPIIKELMSRETLSEAEQGYLGVSGYDVTEDASKYYNIPIGVYIADVPKGGAAEKAGLKAEDIITKVNDIEITSITQLKNYVNSFKVGTKVEVTYMRNTDGDYKEAKLTVTLGKSPSLSDSKK